MNIITTTASIRWEVSKKKVILSIEPMQKLEIRDLDWIRGLKQKFEVRGLMGKDK